MNKYIDLSSRLLCDLELLMNGSFAPLKGFMNKEDYCGVLNNMRLSSGELWPMPIVLPINKNKYDEIKNENYVILRDYYNLPIAKLKINDIFEPDLDQECMKVYGSIDDNHPYVKIVNEFDDGTGVWYVGGSVEKINDICHFDFKEHRQTPLELKNTFLENKWKTIVGFQTRNPMHKSHYELTKYALSQTNSDDAKVLIQPIVGVTQECDVDYYTRVKCYKLILNHYPENTAMLSLLPLSMRMAGPREAMWHALIRKNYGCTHFVVGRDHAGPSSNTKKGNKFYGPYDAHELLEKYKDEMGIKIIKSKWICYVKELDDYRAIDNVPEGMSTMSISGTEQRRRLRAGEEIPEWFTFPDIVQELRKSTVSSDERGFCIYLVGLSGSGKTTVSNNLKSKLHELTHRTITILDGDVVRRNLSKGLTFSKEDRSINVRRIGYVAAKIVRHRGIVICANIAPYDEDRLANRKLISKHGGYFEVFVNTSLSVCEVRDTKGLYKLAREGIIKQFTGISDPFETPTQADIEINESITLEHAISKIVTHLIDLEYLNK
jgi:sulfate adenylyltransferase